MTRIDRALTAATEAYAEARRRRDTRAQHAAAERLRALRERQMRRDAPLGFKLRRIGRAISATMERVVGIAFMFGAVVLPGLASLADDAYAAERAPVPPVPVWPLWIIIGFGFAFAAWIAWRIVKLITEQAEQIPEDDGPDAPIDYRKFRQ